MLKPRKLNDNEFDYKRKSLDCPLVVATTESLEKLFQQIRFYRGDGQTYYYTPIHNCSSARRT